MLLQNVFTVSWSAPQKSQLKPTLEHNVNKTAKIASLLEQNIKKFDKIAKVCYTVVVSQSRDHTKRQEKKMDKNTMQNLLAGYLGCPPKAFEIESHYTTHGYTTDFEKVTIRFTKWSSLCGMRWYGSIHHLTGKVYAN